MDIMPAILDPELGCTTFTVERITYTRSRGGIISRSVAARAQGCIHPGTPEMLQLLPEEEQHDTYIEIYTDYPLSTGIPEADGGCSFTGPDRIRWSNRTWRVIRVRDWQGFGYVHALAMLMHESA